MEPLAPFWTHACQETMCCVHFGIAVVVTCAVDCKWSVLHTPAALWKGQAVALSHVWSRAVLPCLLACEWTVEVVFTAV